MPVTMTFRLIKLTPLLMVLVILFDGVLMSAQTETRTRALQGRVTGDESHVDLQVFDEEDISTVQLMTNDGLVEFSPMVMPPTIRHWFVVDGGESMLDAYPAVRDELGEVIALASESYQIGVISYGADVSVIAPTDDKDALRQWLSAYRAQATEQGCVGDALNQITSDESAEIVTIITAQTELSSGCTLPDVSNQMVIDGLQLNDSEFLVQLVGSSDGVLVTSTIARLSSAFASLPTSVTSDIRRYGVETDRSIDEGIVMIDLTTGQRIEQTLQFIQDIAIEDAPSATEIVTGDVPLTTDADSSSAETASNSATPLATTDVPTPDNDPAPFSNLWIVVMGSVLAGIAVLGTGFVLLRNKSSTTLDDATKSELNPLDGTQLVIDTPPLLDQTQVVTMRDIAETLGETHVANLSNEADDLIYEIHRPLSVLGRQVGSDILIANDMQISREHVRFDTREDGAIWLVRLTTNPILINGMPIQNTHQLREGDVLQLSPNLQVTFTKLITEDA